MAEPTHQNSAATLIPGPQGAEVTEALRAASGAHAKLPCSAS